MELIYTATGLVCGFAAGFFLLKWKYAPVQKQAEDALRLAEENDRMKGALHQKDLLLVQKESDAKSAQALAQSEKKIMMENHDRELAALKSHYEDKLERERTASAERMEESGKAFAAERTAWEKAREVMLQNFEESRKAAEKNFQTKTDLLKEEFRTISEKILTEKSGSLQNVNREQIAALLNPLNEKMAEFRKAVETSQNKDIELNTELKTQISLMMEAAGKIGNKADNLANALTGERKTQGNFGEFILEDLLKRSGLRNGIHYECQETIRDDAGNMIVNEQNRKMRPDVIVHYPDGKDLIIDSKASLTAYVDYMNAETQEEKEQALARHIQSVRNHVDELAKKKYSDYLHHSARETIDFMVMFIPNEGPFRLAMIEAPSLWEEAFARKVMIISPTNLLALLRLIQIAWTREEQTRNQQKIVDTAAQLLDRIYTFFKEFDDVGIQIEKTAKAYNDAVHKLKKEGQNQSVVGAAEKLVALGVRRKADKKLPPRFQPEESPEHPGLFEKDGIPQLSADPEN